MDKKELIVLMGISGSGKSTIGKLLSQKLGVPFLDADDFHPKENVLKMNRGIPLDDDDRWPWLASIVEYVSHSHRNQFILGCSALKVSYRDYLSQRLNNQYILLDISKAEAIARMEARKGHFMPSSLVQSQLATLEKSPDLISISTDKTPEEMVNDILEVLRT
ncbi:gluconokinase [Roseivirga pacifica]